MHREKLRQLLTRYSPSLSEVESKRAMLHFLESDEHCFERENCYGHFTGSAWIENYAGDMFLLTKHKKFRTWLQLGGHADGNPDIAEVAMTEAVEESGLHNLEFITHSIFDISVHKIPIYGAVASHYHYDVRFLLRATNSNEKIAISNESDDLRWVNSIPEPDPNDYVMPDRADFLRMQQKWYDLKTKH